MTAQLACPESTVTVAAPQRVEIEGIAVAVVRDSDGVIHAIGDTCTHGEISLSEGFVEDDTIECWAHGSRFSLVTGRPQNLPAFEPVPVFPVTIEDGDVYVDVRNPIDIGD